MRLSEICDRVDARVLTRGTLGGVTVDRVCASDRMSEMLDKASSRTLLVSRLASRHLLRVAQLMDVPGLCLAGGVMPGEGLIRAAEDQGTILMASPLEPGEIVERLGLAFPAGSIAHA